MIYRYISSKVVIGRVSRFVEDQNWISTSFLDLGDAIQEIGYASKKTATSECELLQVFNHKVELPCNLEFIEKIEYKGDRLPITKDSSILGLSKDDYKWNRAGDFYSVNYPFIHTSFAEGEIKLFYRQYEIDNEGFLVIPDIAEYRLALQWYILSSLLLQGYRLKDNSISHNYCMNMFMKYKTAAKSKVKRFSKDERLSFSRMWNSLNTEYIDSILIDNE